MCKIAICGNCIVILIMLDYAFGNIFKTDRSEMVSASLDDIPYHPRGYRTELKLDKRNIMTPLLLKNLEPENKKRDLQWPLGKVPYYVDEGIYDSMIVNRIRLVMNQIEESSCVQFQRILQDAHPTSYIRITNEHKIRECVHETASNGSRKEVVMVLGLDCMQRRDILHSLMHTLGLKDEITHPQRDQYVRVLWDNINPKYRSLFHVNFEASPMTEYDPMSIMHFHDRAFTRNGRATIAPLIPGLVINPSKHLSPLDKMKLRLMFGHECNRRKVEDLVDVCKAALQENEPTEESVTHKNDADGDKGNDDNNNPDKGPNDENDNRDNRSNGNNQNEGNNADNANNNENNGGGDVEQGGEIQNEADVAVENIDSPTLQDQQVNNDD